MRYPGSVRLIIIGDTVAHLPVSPIFDEEPRFCAGRENWRTRESGPERSDERGIRANRSASGGLGRSPEHSESIPLSPPAFAQPTAGRPAASRRPPSRAWSLSAEPKAKAARRRLGEGGHYPQHRHPPPMHYVYLIESVYNRSQHYVGQTGDLKERISEHNSGKSVHTALFRPWHLVCYLGFADEKKAIAFEHYLKSGSGKTFLQRHFL